MSRFILTLKSFVVVLAIAGPARADDSKPTLYLVSVGVSKYTYKPYERGVFYAAKDARDIANLFKSQEGNKYGKVEVKLLTDSQATQANIQKALTWLKTKATQDSQVIVFLAGHGGPDPLGRYEYVPNDTHPVLPSSKISGKMLFDALEHLPGQRLLLLDTCFAGGFAGKKASFLTLASCNAKETSTELSSKQNGCFTSVLVSGLSGKADLNKDGIVTLSEVTTYIKSNLSALTGGKQHVTCLGTSNQEFALPLVQATSTPGPTLAKGQ